MLLSERIQVTRHEMETAWSFADLVEANDMLDIYEKAMSKRGQS